MVILLIGAGLTLFTYETLIIEKNKFVGTWKESVNVSSYNASLIFFSDGTFSMSMMRLSGTWDIKGGKLVLSASDQAGQFVYSYSFSNNDRTLTLSDMNGKTGSFTKQ